MTPVPAKKGFDWSGWAPWLLLLVGFATFANTLENPFIFDDRLPIEESEHIKRLWPLTAPSQSAPAGRPVVILSLAINYAIGELDPRGYHIFNIAVHVLASMVLFGVVRRTLEGAGLGARFGRSAAPIALACALIWLLHPIQTEVINYVVQRTSSMMSLFYLLTFYCAIRAVDSARPAVWYAGAGAAALLGMMCKESMATVVALLVLYDIAFLGGGIASLLRRRWPLYVALVPAYIVLGIIMAAGPRAEVVTFDTHVSWLDYALNQLVVITHYFMLVLWPHPLVLDYGETLPVAVGRVIAPGILILFLVGASVYALFRWPRLGFLGLAVFIILAPSSSIIPLVPEVGAERRMHLPLAAIVVLLVLLGREILARWFPDDSDDQPQAWPAMIAVALVAVVLAAVSVRRNNDYRSRVSIWTTAARAAPGNARAHYNLGVVLVDEGRLEEADPSLRRAIALKPNYHEAHYNLGLSLAQRGRLEDAVAAFATAIRIDPDDEKYQNNMGVALSTLGRNEEAIGYFEEAVRIDPEKTGARYNLGSALMGLGRYAEAIDELRQALAVDPGHADSHGNLGVALLMTGETEEGHRHVAEAARLQPNSPSPLIAAARALAQHPDPSLRDPAKAIEYARRAVDLTQGRHLLALTELSTCFAVAGEWDQAARTLESAIELARASGRPQLISQLETRAEQYRRQQ